MSALRNQLRCPQKRTTYCYCNTQAWNGMLDKFNIVFFGNVFSSLFSSSFKKISPFHPKKNNHTKTSEQRRFKLLTKKKTEIYVRYTASIRIPLRNAQTFIHPLIRERKYGPKLWMTTIIHILKDLTCLSHSRIHIRSVGEVAVSRLESTNSCLTATLVD